MRVFEPPNDVLPTVQKQSFSKKILEKLLNRGTKTYSFKNYSK